MESWQVSDFIQEEIIKGWNYMAKKVIWENNHTRTECKMGSRETKVIVLNISAFEFYSSCMR
jgi:hypothetical protein